MNKDWFELSDYINQKADKQVWVPLRCSIKPINEGESGHVGFREEYVGTTSVMIKPEDVPKAKELEWMDVGLIRGHKGNPYEDEYEPAHCFNRDGVVGEHLLIAHEIGGDHCDNWYLSPDLLTTLELIQEGDVWLAYNRGYEEVIKLKRNENGCANEVLIRASYLKDYLAVRKRVLAVFSYKSRTEVQASELETDWDLEKIIDVENGIKWGGRVSAIHEGGQPFGSEVAIFHMGRTNINHEEEVPEFPFSDSEDNVKSESWTRGFDGKKMYRVEGEVWKTDFVYPLTKSRIILDDDEQKDEYRYKVDSDGSSENANKLVDSGKYLWFKPELIESILSHRGAELSWYTRDTGGIGFGRGSGVHFGVNKIALITVYAKDVALLDDWQQKVWHAHNVSPDGGVSSELLMSQQEAVPAKTLPPEDYFKMELDKLNENFENLFGEKLIKHDKVAEIAKDVHRFVATRKNGLFILAKDIARLTADSFDVAALKKSLGNKEEYKKLAALKLMEALLTKRVVLVKAKEYMAPLFYSYDLRISDAHIPSKETIEHVYKQLGITDDTNNVERGRILIHEVTTCLATINQVLQDME